MKTFLIILIILFILLLLLFFYCACKVASLADERMERILQEDSDVEEWKNYRGTGNCFGEIVIAFLIKIKIKFKKF